MGQGQDSCVATRRTSRQRSIYLVVLTFFGGFNVMLLEICAFRVLSTTFGGSVHVTGILLALIMVALSMGYYLGGYLSSKAASARILLASVGACAVYALVTNTLLAREILEACFRMNRTISTLSSVYFFPTSLAALILYFPPMLVLGQVSPFLIQFMARHAGGDQAVGRIAGKLMAISTLGSVIGTTATSFVFLPALGVQRTLLIFYSSLAILVAFGRPLLPHFRRLWLVPLVLTILIGWRATATGLATTSIGRKGARLIYEGESRHGNIKVLAGIDDQGPYLFYQPNWVYVHSKVHPNAPVRDVFFLEYIAFWPAVAGKRVLVLGTALGTVLAQMVEIAPSAELTGVDIDPVIVSLSQELVPQLRSPNVKLIARDARLFLRETSERYDYIIVDLFAGGFIPSHCITEEFFSLVLQRLAPDGAMFMNSNMTEFLAFEGESMTWAPVRHLQSTIFNAGFAQIVRTDLFSNGHMVAFPVAKPISVLRDHIRRQAARADLPLEHRSLLTVESFNLHETPVERRHLRPFTDDWVPDHLVQLKDNRPAHLRAAAKAVEGPWKKTMEDSDALRPVDIARRRFWRLSLRSGRDPRSYGEGKESNPFCREVFDWVSRSSGATSELLPYVFGGEFLRCEADFDRLASDAPGERIRRFRDFVKGASLLSRGKGAEAWSYLSGVLESPGVL
jgi:predicted membrane-bound spermidine synthase